MRLRLLTFVLACCSASAVSPAANVPPAPVEVMIVGVYHMSNPGHDLHNMQVDDVLAPRRQAELAAVTAALARFRPTRIAVEWDPPIVAERYPRYLAGTLPPSRNEVVQLGFRLGKAAGSKPVYGIDADGDFLYQPLRAYAEAHGLAGLLVEQGGGIDRFIAEQQRILATRGISAVLRRLNDPVLLRSGNAWYRTTLRIGAANQQPGADLLTGWYRRNFLICANLLQISQPGDRIVVFFGSGHAFLLRQCVSETPGLRLVEPNRYLPR